MEGIKIQFRKKCGDQVNLHLVIIGMMSWLRWQPHVLLCLFSLFIILDIQSLTIGARRRSYGLTPSSMPGIRVKPKAVFINQYYLLLLVVFEVMSGGTCRISGPLPCRVTEKHWSNALPLGCEHCEHISCSWKFQRLACPTTLGMGATVLLQCKKIECWPGCGRCGFNSLLSPGCCLVALANGKSLSLSHLVHQILGRIKFIKCFCSEKNVTHILQCKK